MNFPRSRSATSYSCCSQAMCPHTLVLFPRLDGYIVYWHTGPHLKHLALADCIRLSVSSLSDTLNLPTPHLQSISPWTPQTWLAESLGLGETLPYGVDVPIFTSHNWDYPQTQVVNFPTSQGHSMDSLQHISKYLALEDHIYQQQVDTISNCVLDTLHDDKPEMNFAQKAKSVGSVFCGCTVDGGC